MPRDFYPADLTDRSFAVLERLVADYPDAVLIGGWGTWVRARGAKSHDIDLIVDNAALDAIRGDAAVTDFSATEHVGGRKYRATIDGIHLDLYVPHQSRLGQRLALRVENLVAYDERTDSWHVLTPPAHAATKVAALLDRPDTQPGQKDRHEILALLEDLAPEDVVQVIAATSERDLGSLRDALTVELFGYLEEAEPGKQKRQALRAQAKQWAATIARVTGV